jgi:ATP:ADP antiporter, AAA family
MRTLVSRATRKLVDIRTGEGAAAALMFAYSLLAMTSYNILRPVAQSKFIDELGAENLPYVLFVAGIAIGVLMHGYTAAMRRAPRRWIVPGTQLGIVALLLVFWGLFRAEVEWTAAAFYLARMVLGILLISQFWTIANDIYDARQAKRLFGFIGAGASLGGTFGAGLTLLLVREIGTTNLLLVSAFVLALCAAMVAAITSRRPAQGEVDLVDEQGLGSRDALGLLLVSPHIRIVALVIGLAAGGAAIIDQQLSMAAEANHEGDEAIAAFLAQVMVYVSLAGFVVQLTFTSRIHRSLGLLFALLLLPVALGGTALLILMTGSLWAAGAARVVDATLRYTIDRTTREVLFLPISADIKYRAKPFIDVTVDRMAKSLAALLLLVLIQPWGLALDWRHLSYASLAVTGTWIVAALAARREYLRAFRTAIDMHTLVPAALRVDAADAATIETLVEELSSPDEAAVIYAIEMLEALDKRNLVTPLLLHHESPRVRTRALLALHATRSGTADRWIAAATRMLKDDDAGVRAAAMRALVTLRQEDATVLMRRFLADPEPRVAVTAAAGLADSAVPADVEAAADTLRRLAEDTREEGAAGRREAAAALAHIRDPRFRLLLVPLLSDLDARVAEAAIHSAREMGASDGLFVPALVARLGDRTLKNAAREALVAYGEDMLDALGCILNDPHEQVWIRRHLPATLALVPSQRAMDALMTAIDDPDGFVRYKVLASVEALHRARPDLVYSRAVIETRVLKEASRCCVHLSLRHNIVQQAGDPGGTSLLLGALTDKQDRALDRMYRLLGLLHPDSDIAAARRAIEQTDPRRRAAALEYLDNVLGGTIRRHVMPLVDDAPIGLKVQHANTILGTRPRDLEDTLAQLVHDDDPVIAASAIHFIVEHERWSLVDDLEFIVSRRAGNDPYVANAAVWALAQRTLGGRSRDGTAASLPLVALAQRLRIVPLFQQASVDELLRVCEVGRQVRYPDGHDVSAEQQRADAIHVLLDGSVRESDASGESHLVSAPAVLALEHLLTRAPISRSIRAVGPVVCFCVDRIAWLTMLAHSAQLTQGLFRALLAGHGTVTRTAPVVTGAVRLPSQPVDRMLLLRQHSWLERASVEQLSRLTARAEDVPLVAGRHLSENGETAAIYQVITGEVRLESGDAPLLIAPGAAFGILETLAGVPFDMRPTVTRDGHALRLDRAALFEVLADDVALLEGVIGGVVSTGASPVRV